MPPEVIAGRYRVEGEIGRGGMGAVWRCRDELLGRVVAVKEIGLLPGESTTDLGRAMREARSTAALNHPHVVSVFDAVEEDDRVWLVMEHIRGRSLSQLLAAEGPLPPGRVARLGAQVAEGLAAAHARGIVHRDVKPGNVLVTDDDRALISDFGIARAHGDATLTRSGMVTGTPSYFSPELARGGDSTPATDVWALGATLYAAVEGHPPFVDQGNALAVLARIAEEPVPEPTRAGFLAEPLRRMLDRDPATRWEMADAAQTLRRLHERHLHDDTREQTAPVAARDAAPVVAAEVAPAPAPAEDAQDSPERRRRGAGLLLVGMLVVLLGAPGLGWLAFAHDGEPGSSAGPGASTSHTPSHTPSRTPSPTPSHSSPPATEPTHTSAPSSDATQGGPPSVPEDSVTQFARRYYGVLPSDTRSGWSMLSSGFHREIGGYGHYRGFWDTIRSVSVQDATPQGSRAVDVRLLYTDDNGGTSREVRRLYLERSGNSYLITGDQVVG